MVSWARDGSLKIWLVDRSERGQVTLRAHTRAILGVHVLSEEQQLSWSEDGTLLHTFRGYLRRVWGVVVLSERHFVSWAEGEAPRLWGLLCTE